MPALCFFSERSRVGISFSVRSGCLATRSSSHYLCLSSGERLWPVPGLASTLHVVVKRSIQRIAVEAPILRSHAASRALSPASTIANTRTLRSMIHTAGHSYSRTTLSATSSKVFGNSVSDLS